MLSHRIITRGVCAFLACGALMACETAPTEPAPLPPSNALELFSRLTPAEEPSDGTPIETECPAGGSFTYEGTSSIEKTGEITIRRFEWIRRFHDCGLRRGSSVITASGETHVTGEAHLENEDSAWPQGVLYSKTHQVGTVFMRYSETEVHRCDDDFVQISEPAAGRYSIKGTVCGTPVDREISLPASRMRVITRVL